MQVCIKTHLTCSWDKSLFPCWKLFLFCTYNKNVFLKVSYTQGLCSISSSKVTSRLGSLDACWSATVNVSNCVYRSWWRTLCDRMCLVTMVLYRGMSRTITWWTTCWLTLIHPPSWTVRWAAGKTVRGSHCVTIGKTAVYQSLSYAFARYREPWKWTFAPGELFTPTSFLPLQQ